jgi:ribokinase
MSEVIGLASWNADLVSRVPRPIARGETLMASAFTIGPAARARMRPSPAPGRAPGSP